MKTKDVLIKARAVLVKKGWNQRSYAQDKDGNETFYASPEACSFCAAGAVMAATSNGGERNRAVARLVDLIPWNNVTRWNDDQDRTKRQVLALYTRAIKAL